MRLDRHSADKSKRAGSLIILPERNMPRARILMPVHDREWRQPSQRLYTYDIPNKTRFRLTARTHDGLIVWRGFFDDRADADVFVHAIFTGEIRYDRKLWSLPNETWTPRERYGNVGFTAELLDPNLVYQFATVTFLTSGAGSNQSWSLPSDWSTNNYVEVIGAGGPGWGNLHSVGGGGCGGDYAKSVGLTGLSGSITYRAGDGKTGGSTGGAVAGGDSWFNDTAFPTTGQAVGAKGGNAGGSWTQATAQNAASTAYAVGTGSAKYSGGRGGFISAGNAGSGAGGAASPLGAGKDGGTPNNSGTPDAGGGGGASGGGSNGGNASGTTSGAGGNNDASAGGGAASTGAANNGSNPSGVGHGAGGGSGGGASGSSNNGGNGGAGQDWDSTHGAGAGGGGAGIHTSTARQGGTGGLYGGGGGGGGASGGGISSIGGDSAQGIVVPTYTPAAGLAFSSKIFQHMLVR